jgi:hypothetical protein
MNVNNFIVWIKYIIEWLNKKNVDLSLVKLMEFVFLCDRRSAIIDDKLITNYNRYVWSAWIFSEWFLNDIESIINESKNIWMIKNNSNNKMILNFTIPDNKSDILWVKTSNVLDFALELHFNIWEDKFTEIIYSLYPVLNSDSQIKVDLIKSAREYFKKQINLTKK